MIVLIPARAGSQRIPRKNIRELAGHPLILYTIAAARQAAIFAQIWVSTNDAETMDTVDTDVHIRPESMAAYNSIDFDWISHFFSCYKGKPPDCFAILRPTNPFRQAFTIRMAHDRFIANDVDSLRAVERVRQHPRKMWNVADENMDPYVLTGNADWEEPTQSFETLYVQNGCIEIVKTETLKTYGNISGKDILPFFTHGYEGFDINTEEDWLLAETLIERGLAKLPELKNEPILYP